MRVRFTIAFLCMTCAVKAQVITQDAEGESPIVWSGGTAGIDVSDGLVKINFYGTGAGDRVIWGLDLQAKNESGVAQLFNEGDFTPKSQVSGLIGGKMLIRDQNAYKADINSRTPINKLDQAKLDKKKPAGQARMRQANAKNMERQADRINRQQRHAPNYNLELLYYIRGGLNVNEFTLDHGKDSALFDIRFVDTTDTKGFVELGCTFRGKEVMIGGALGYSGVNNFSELVDQEYNFTQVDTSLKDGVLQQSKTITAYSGNFGRTSKVYLKVDFLYLHLLNKGTPPPAGNNNEFVGFGVYWRSNFHSDALLFDNTVLGGTISFISGTNRSIIGGVYVQTNDLFSQDDKSFGKSVSIGLVTKLAFADLGL